MTKLIPEECPRHYGKQLLGSSDGERGFCTVCMRWYELKEIKKKDAGGTQ